MFLKIAKTIYLLLIFYMVWFQQVFFTIDHALLSLGSVMLLFWFLHKLTTKKDRIYVTKPIIIWLIFFFYIFLTGFIVAIDKTLLISSVMTYVQIIFIMIFIIDVSLTQKSNKFFIYSFIVLSLISAVTIVFFGFESSREQLHLSQNSNPNSDGKILIFGIFCMILLLINVRNRLLVITLIFSILFNFYGIILTGSRQVFLAGFILLVLSLITLVVKKWKVIKTKNKLLLMAMTIIFLLLILIKFESLFIESTIHHRLTVGLDQDLSRIEMVKTSLDYFKENPFFGIGFDQFRVYFGGYSHSTYTEIISTTGMIGSILYLLPYIIILYNIIKINRDTKDTNVSIEAKVYLILMLTLIFLGISSIHFYSVPENIMFALMISFYYIQKYDKVKRLDKTN